MDLLLKLWSDSFKLNKRGLEKHYGLPPSKDFIDSYYEMVYNERCNKHPNSCIQFFAEKGAKNFNGALRSVSRYNHRKIIDYLLTQNVDVSYGMNGAAEGDQLELLRKLVNKYGIEEIDEVMEHALEFGVSAELIEEGASDLDSALEAATKENVGLVKHIIQKGATDLNRALIQAVKLANKRVIEYLVKLGAKEL